jgi:ABC-2 type transport system permease protein
LPGASPSSHRSKESRPSRLDAGIAYALLSAAFVWQLFGSVLGAPTWLLDISPFRHVGLVPAQSFRAGAAAVMVAIGAAGSLAALAVFARRDLSAA